jgi:tungsten cofactor oxidoreducase radical SAM maturase
MKKIYLELTNKCNLNCVMCYRKAWHEALKDMTKEHLIKCVQEIKESSVVEEVVLGGIGEPTFSESIEWVIEELGEKNLTITTNGTLMNDTLLQLVTNNVKKLVISIDGVGDTFYAIRHFPLEDVLKSLDQVNTLKEKLKSTTPVIVFQMVLSAQNYTQIEAVIDIAHRYKADEVILSNLIPSAIEDVELTMVKMYEKEPLATRLKLANKHALSKRITLHLPEIRMKTERHCRFIEDETMMITVDGCIVPCYRFAHDGAEVVFGRLKEIKTHSFGHIANQKLEEIWKSEEYVNYRQMVLTQHYPSCIDCDLVDGCDMAKHAESDCYGNVPSCADCLWSRKIIQCV